jgi:aminoglycoside 6'-N-acetyltransferase
VTTADLITGVRVRLRPAVAEDADAFRRILATPEVSRWWGGDPEQGLAELMHPDDDTRVYAIELGGVTVGLIQYYEETDPMYRHAGIDISVHPDHHGRGIGSDAVYALARHLIEERGHHRLVIDPRADNEVAIRTYRKVGFRPVGVMRRYERAADGTWRDGLLMDLLADELTAPTMVDSDRKSPPAR